MTERHSFRNWPAVTPTMSESVTESPALEAAAYRDRHYSERLRRCRTAELLGSAVQTAASAASAAMTFNLKSCD